MTVDVTTARHPARLHYLPGIDALRALAVLAVLAYHANWEGVPGGFLGVDVFLVISGYLITALLLTERASAGQVSLRRFWWRRARRLLPAVLLVLGFWLAYAVVFLPDEVAGLRADALASLSYVTNWYLIFSDQSYFAAFARPSLFRHLWSLAVEEQFYLLWPVVFVAGLGALGRRRLLVAVAAGIAASTALMWVLFEPGGDPSRVYYGTDTRLAGLLVGAALALVWHPQRLRSQVGRRAPALLDGIGVVALVLLVRQFLVVDEFDPSLYRGGFLHVALLTAVVLAVVAHPAARLGRVLGRPALLWLGLRSYGVYLWHWPVFMVTRPGVDVGLDGPGLLAVRLGLTALAAELSYRFVELPVRRGALERGWARWQARPAGGLGFTPGTLMGAAAATVLVGLLGVAVVSAERPPPSQLVAGAAGYDTDTGRPLEVPPSGPVTVVGTTTSPTVPSESPGGAGAGTAGPTTTAAPTPSTVTTTAPATTAPTYPAVLALGDSVMLGAAASLTGEFEGQITVDAVVSRPFEDGVWAARYYRDHVGLPSTVLVHLGNNGHFTTEQFDELMEALAGVDRVVFFTTRVNQRWQDEVNGTIVAGVERFTNARVADWHGLSADHPEYFVSDQTHLTPLGADVYAQFLAAQVNP